MMLSNNATINIKLKPGFIVINPVPKYRIVIDCDGDTTTAKMIVNGKEVKSATAKRNPADKANWRIGAQVAFDRLWQKQPKPEKPAENGGFKVGDRVVCTEPCFECSGKHGRIAVVEKGRRCNIGVEFDEDFPGSHSCSDKIKSGRGYWLFADSLSHEQPTNQKAREVKRRAKAGEWVKIVRADGSAGEEYQDGDILQVITNGYGLDFLSCGGGGASCSEYVVLEGYQPGRDA